MNLDRNEEEPRRNANGVAPADQRDVRRHNLALVVGHIVEHGPRSRATIAAETGLNKATVSSLVAELVDLAILVEGGTERPGAVGRPARILSVQGDVHAALGLEVNVDYIAATVVDLLGRVRFRANEAMNLRDSRPSRGLKKLVSLAQRGRSSAADQGLRLAGPTVALPGIMDTGKRRLLSAVNLGWRDIDVADLIEEELGLPADTVHVDNEANLAALGELLSGSGRGLRDFVLVTGDVGVGAGIVQNGALLVGAEGFAGEVGHIVVDPAGPTCACGGAGHLEVMAGLGPLLEAHDGDVARLRDTVSRGGDVARQLTRVGHWLGIGLASVANLINPEALILGGHYATFADVLIGPVEEALDQHLLSRPHGRMRVLVSSLGQEAAVRGAAARSVDMILRDPAVVNGSG